MTNVNQQTVTASGPTAAADEPKVTTQASEVPPKPPTVGALRAAHENYEKAVSALFAARERCKVADSAALNARFAVEQCERDLNMQDMAVAEAKRELMGDKAVAQPEDNACNLAGLDLAPARKVGRPKGSKNRKAAVVTSPPTQAASNQRKPAVKKGKEFAKWITDARIKSGLTRTAFAESIGATEIQVWAWEKGKSATGEQMLQKLESVLGPCPVERLASKQ